MNGKIYVNYFSPAHIFEDSLLSSIQVGRANSNNKLQMLGDDVGDNISFKNPYYCELTGQYFVWKNAESQKYCGFLHYRRLFDFSDRKDRKIENHGAIEVASSRSLSLPAYGITESSIDSLMDNYDCILPYPFDVTRAAAKNVRDQYLLAPYHDVRHLDEAGRIIEEKFPQDSQYFVEAMKGVDLYSNNMFVMRTSLFQQYSAWLFAILFELEKRIDVTGRSWQEQRAIGYVAERLLTTFAIKLRSENKFTIKFLNRVFINDPSPVPQAKPKPIVAGLPVVTVAASTDRLYVQHMAALLSSTLSNASQESFIDFIVLDGGLTDADRARLLTLEARHPHCRISFVDMRNEYLDIPPNSYFTRGTFYRLSLPQILADRDRVLFLDTDMVVCGDIATLFSIELKDEILAAAPDLIMRAFCNMGVFSIKESGAMRANCYLTDKIKLKSPRDYFQAGVLLFNLDIMRRLELAKKMTNSLKTESYWFLDQDVLNIYSSGRVRYLDNRWNVVHMDENHLSALDESDRKTYDMSMQSPLIVHYAGVNKPWVNQLHPHSSLYWIALRNTPWYEMALLHFVKEKEVIYSEVVNSRSGTWLRKSVSLWLARKIWRSLPQSMRNKLIPMTTRFKKKISTEI